MSALNRHLRRIIAAGVATGALSVLIPDIAQAGTHRHRHHFVFAEDDVFFPGDHCQRNSNCIAPRLYTVPDGLNNGWHPLDFVIPTFIHPGD